MQFSIQNLFCISFAVLTAVTTKILSSGMRCCSGYCLHLQGATLKMAAVDSSKTMVPIYKITQHHIPEEIIFSVTMKTMTVHQRTVPYTVLLHSSENYFVPKKKN